MIDIISFLIGLLAGSFAAIIVIMAYFVLKSSIEISLKRELGVYDKHQLEYYENLKKIVKEAMEEELK